MKYADLSFGQTEALMNKIGGMDGLARVLSGEWVVGEPVKVLKRAPRRGSAAGLLEPIGGPVAIPATERFVAGERFVLGHDGDLPVSYMGEDFAKHFLDVVEHDLAAAKVRQRALVKSSIDDAIFAALGGKSAARIPLASMFAFLKGADRSRWYFFYVADAKGELWAIDAYWRDHGWDLEAYSVTYPRGWRGGGRVVSR